MAGRDCIEAMKREAVMLEKNIRQIIERFEENFGVAVKLVDSPSGESVIPEFLEVQIVTPLHEAREAIDNPGGLSIVERIVEEGYAPLPPVTEE